MKNENDCPLQLKYKVNDVEVEPYKRTSIIFGMKILLRFSCGAAHMLQLFAQCCETNDGWKCFRGQRSQIQIKNASMTR